MLHLHFSNHYEALTSLLLQHLGHAPEGQPGAAPWQGVFAAHQVIVPSLAVRRAVTLDMARTHGVCAQVQFHFLAQWLWWRLGSHGATDPGASPYAAPLLTWRVLAAWQDPGWVAAHPRLAAYLAGADTVMQFELARRSAELLEQYSTYRPDILLAWAQGGKTPAAHPPAGRLDNGPDTAWQAALWRHISPALGPDADPSAKLQLQALQRPATSAAQATGRAAPAHVFVLPTIAPLHLHWLQQLGQQAELHLYLLNPCREHWFDLVDRRRLSQLAVRQREQGYEEGNRLLAAWGRQTQAHLDAVVDASGSTTLESEQYVENPASSLLARLQNAILDLRPMAPGSLPLQDGDRSIEVHVCHSLTRELEVLQDHLLGLFAQASAEPAEGTAPAPPLLPSQVVVLLPDLEAAAPLIDAVFGTAPQRRAIPYAITGRARSRVDEVAQTALAWLALLGSRMAASEVFALLQRPLVARRFGLDDEALQQVHGWLGESGTRWALDAEHRASFGVPADGRHSFEQGLARLTLGYALPAEASEPWSGLLPAGNAQGSAALSLGALWQFVQILFSLQAQAAQARQPAAWASWLQQAWPLLMQADETQQDAMLALQSAVSTLCQTMQQAGFDAALPLPVLRAALELQLDDPAKGGVAGGAVTFAAMSSLRSLPFEVVCVLGLNDGAFPSAARPLEFDLMAQAPRRGDRQRRSDERNLFLDLLLAARRSLYLSHTGRSIRDNAALPPSVLVAELLDLLIPAIASDPASPAALASARQRLLVAHPLQPFSLQAFALASEPRLRSFDSELGAALQHSLRTAARLVAANSAKSLAETAAAPAAQVALAASAGKSALALMATTSHHTTASVADSAADPDLDGAFESSPAFFTTALPDPEPEWQTLSLLQLLEFLRNPCRYLLRRRLRIELQHPEATLVDDEPFLPDRRTRQALANSLLPALLGPTPPADLGAWAQAAADWPSGSLGAATLETELQALQTFADRVQEATVEPLLPQQWLTHSLLLNNQTWQLTATLADLRPSGGLGWRYQPVGAADLLQAWLQHLALCLARPPGVALRTRWLAADSHFSFKPVDDAAALLDPLVALYRQGLCEPLHFFPKSAWAWVNSGGSQAAVARTWRVTRESPWAEGSNAYFRLALRGEPEPLGSRFQALAEAVFEPLRDHLDAPG